MRIYGSELKRKPSERMARAFPTLANEQIPNYVEQYFTAMSWFAAEFIKALSPFNNQSDIKSSIANPDIFSHITMQNRVTICFCSHSYNYENLVALTCGLAPDLDIYLVYSSIKNMPLFDFLIKWKRTRFSNRLHSIPASSSLRLYKTALQHAKGLNPRHAVIAILNDAKTNNAQNKLELLGFKRGIALGGEKIGQRLNAAFLYASCSTISRGVNQYTFYPLDRKSSPTRQFLHFLQRDIRRQPFSWMLWNE